MRDLAAFDTAASRALRFTILCAARAGETRGATWGEIQNDVWSIPGERMKEGVPHSVPLTSEALALLGPHGELGELIFKSPTGAMPCTKTPCGLTSRIAAAQFTASGRRSRHGLQNTAIHKSIAKRH
jgi:integrase